MSHVALREYIRTRNVIKELYLKQATQLIKALKVHK